jgi:fucose 4-O-acetylase-like acetyltransferase
MRSHWGAVLASFGKRYRQNLQDSFHPSDESGRDFQIDAMKGVTIILVVLGHTLIYYIPQFGFFFWWRVIYSFHMPLFFFLSGYLAYESSKKHKVSSLLSKRFNNLVVPFLSWYFLFGTFLWFFSSDRGYGAYSFNIIRDPLIGLWFLWVLFLCFLALAAALELERYVKVFAYLLILVLVSFFPLVTRIKTPVKFLGLGLLESFLIFFIAGYLLSRYKEAIKELAARYTLASDLINVLALVAFPTLVLVGILSKRAANRIFYPFFLVPPDWYNSIRLVAVIVAFLGIAMVFVAFRMKKSRRAVSWLSWLGLYTIDIYVIHLAGNHFLPRIMAGPLSTGLALGRVLSVLTITIVTIMFSLFVSFFLLRQNKVLKFLFLGKTSGRGAPRAESD